MAELIESTRCKYCQEEIKRPYQPAPNGLFGNMIRCTNVLTCGKEFLVTFSVLRDKEEKLKDIFKRERGMEDPQTTLSEFYDHSANEDLQMLTSKEVN